MSEPSSETDKPLTTAQILKAFCSAMRGPTIPEAAQRELAIHAGRQLIDIAGLTVEVDGLTVKIDV